MVLCVVAPALFGFFIARNPLAGAGLAAAYGFLCGLAFVAVLWTLKAIFVRLSLRRCPHENTTELRGPWPWQW